MKRTAECHCGAFKVIATGEPEHVYVCHCKACQRRTGTAFHLGTFWQKDQVRMEGAYKIYERDTAVGTKIRFYFCPNCGSNICWDADRRPAHYGIAAGNFADTSFPPPTASVWEEEMQPWVELPTVTDHYQQGLSPNSK
jgi:hypothetical protein